MTTPEAIERLKADFPNIRFQSVPGQPLTIAVSLPACGMVLDEATGPLAREIIAYRLLSSLQSALAPSQT